jgi:hypothetical protein
MLQNKGFNFDGFKGGGLQEKQAVATWNLGNSQNMLGNRGKPRKQA